MVWQVVVPGTHTVTVVYRVLMAFTPVGPALTVTLATFEAGVTVPVPDELDPSPGRSPPPQEITARHRKNAQPRNAGVTSELTVGLRRIRRSEALAAGKRAHSVPACGHPTRPPDRPAALRDV